MKIKDSSGVHVIDMKTLEVVFKENYDNVVSSKLLIKFKIMMYE